MAQSYTNTHTVKRRDQIGNYVSIASFVFLAVGAYFALTSLFNPNAELVLPINPNAEPIHLSEILVAYVLMFLAIGLTSLGSRFLIFTRLKPEHKLSLALKGLDKQHRLFNYTLPLPFVLLTPFAVYVLLVKPQEGDILITGDKWSQPFSVLRFLRSFASEPLGNPPRELEMEKEKMMKWLVEKLPDVQVPVEGYVVLLNPGVKAKLMEPTVAPILLGQDGDALKNALRRDKRANLPPSTYDQVAKLFQSHATKEEDE